MYVGNVFENVFIIVNYDMHRPDNSDPGFVQTVDGLTVSLFSFKQD